MIYFPFKNYEEFKELFGMVEHGNGVMSRKNKILLAYYKDRNAWREHVMCMKWNVMGAWWAECSSRATRTSAKGSKHAARWQRIEHFAWKSYENVDSGRLLPESMATLKNVVYGKLQRNSVGNYRLELNNRTFWSTLYFTDDMKGLCEDGTLNAIRYFNVEKKRTFKMKAGKMLNHIIECCPIVNAMPEQVKRWFSEEFVGDWIAYAQEHVNGDKYQLHVNENFSDIYDTDCCKGDFHSCMMDDDNWGFYRDAVDAKAAYLTNEEGDIVARCIIYESVRDEETGEYLRLAERQYSTDCDDNLKRILVNALYRENEIDGHKTIGASCHDARAFVTKSGESLANHRFSIECNLHDGDSLSYQDSFKFFEYDEQRAYNYSAYSDCRDLAETGGTFNYEDHEGQVYSSWNEEWIDEDDAYYIESRSDYFHGHQTIYAYRWNGCSFYEEGCYKGDCIRIDNDYYYAGEDAEYPEDYGLYRCAECDEWTIAGDSYYSELTEEHYCCSDCLEEAERTWHEDNGDAWSDYDEGWFDAHDVMLVLRYNQLGNYFYEESISVESFNDLVDDGEATKFNGQGYIDDINFEGEPVHAVTELCEAV